MIVFLVVLSALIVVHELGHFIAAKFCGVRVERFSIGFGPVLFSRRFGETEFCLALLPLGGYVKMAGEAPEESKGFEWEFTAKKAGQKLGIVLAGPFMNAVLAFVLFVGIYITGQPMISSKIGSVMDGMPGQSAGLAPGDRILRVNGVDVKYWEDLLIEIRKSRGSVRLDVDRQGVARVFTIEPKEQEGKDLTGKKVRVPVIGIVPSNETEYVRVGPLQALWLGLIRVWTLTAMILVSLWLMIVGALPFKESLSGPIGIFFMTQEAARMGLAHLLSFMGSLSVSLFVLNLLPIPVLDGGHIFFLAIEKIKGSPLRDAVKEKMTRGGLILLILLMAFVIVQDVNRFAIVQNIRNMFK